MSGNTSVMKGAILRRADADMRNPTADLLANLKNNDLWSAGINRNVLHSGDEDHVQGDWFGQDWWPLVANKEDILRSGYIKAVTLALQSVPPKPVVSLWVSGLSNLFQVAVMPSTEQVTVLLMTPPHPPTEFPPAASTFPDDLWLVATAAEIEAERQRYPQGPEGYPLPPVEEPLPGSGIHAQQLIGY